jgi:predicted Zn-dependent protease
MRAICLIAAILCWVQPSPAAPSRPTDAALELARNLPAYRAVLQRTPVDVKTAIAQAQALIEEGRRRADIRAFAYAERTLAPLASQAGSNDELALTLADIHQYRHDFAGASALLDGVLARDAHQAEARLMRAQIRLTQGRGADALRDCLALVGRAAPVIWSACAAQAYAINGRLPEAHRLLEDTFRAQPPQGESGAWAAGVMAQLQQQSGDQVGALASLRKALAAEPRDHVVALELIDLLNDTGAQREALDLLQARPASDAYLLRKAQALRAIDARASSQVQAELRRRFAEADALGDRTHLRERAEFELRFGDARVALAAARENFQTQRELIDLRLLLQAAAASRDASGAREAFDWLARTRTQDVRLQSSLRQLGMRT